MLSLMLDAEKLGVIAQLGMGLAGFSGIALVLMRGGPDLSRIETHRLGVMLGVSMGATFLAVLPLVLPGFGTTVPCRVANAAMAAYTAPYLWYYVTATLAMRAQAPEIVTPFPFGFVIAGHAANLALQIVATAGAVGCDAAYGIGLFWMLFHGAYQFARILFIRPHVRADAAPPSDHAHELPGADAAE